MYKRDLIDQMREWSTRTPHKPLVIRGARQESNLGKTGTFGL